MALFEVTTDKLNAIPITSFAQENIFERKDLQRLLRNDISTISSDLLVIAEEYGEWEESSRRIDLLCLSKDAGLTVVEIKRTEDGGHMELQAIRYAAMVSSMTLDQAIEVFSRTQRLSLEDASARVLEFLRFASMEEAELTGNVRIVLVSANFSTEVTTAVLWLNRQGLDITCYRLRPYRVDSRVLVDISQIIPLPETADYEIRLRAQQMERQKVIDTRGELLKRFWTMFIERSRSRTDLLANRSPTTDHYMDLKIGRQGFGLAVSVVKDACKVECNIRLAGGKEMTGAAFSALMSSRADIERSFGSALQWENIPDRHACKIISSMPGGWMLPEAEWPVLQDKLIDAVARLEAALRKPIQELVV